MKISREFRYNELAPRQGGQIQTGVMNITCNLKVNDFSPFKIRVSGATPNWKFDVGRSMFDVQCFC